MSTKNHQKPLYVGTAAERVGESLVTEAHGSMWFETDTGTLYYWNGSSWISIGVGISLDDLSDVEISAPLDQQVLVYVGSVGTWINMDPSMFEGSGGDVATDLLWDAKGDLAVGTGSNTADNLAAGSNGQVPVYASAEATGIKQAYPQPLIGTASATATDSHTANSTYEPVNSMSVTLTVPFDNAKLLCFFTCIALPKSANWEHFAFRFKLDSGTYSELFLQGKNTNPPSGSPQYNFNMHSVFEGVAAGSHTVIVQWYDNTTSLDLDITTRRMTVMVCQ